jgi:cholera toxin transcriptional activator
MDMIRLDTVTNVPADAKRTADLRPTQSTDTRTCLTIRTGNVACYARFDPALYQLTLIKHGVEEKVDLGFSGSRLLERLVSNPGEVVDRDELIDHAWSGRVVGQGSLNQQIYTLRQILSDESTREIIQTLPRRGYLINPKYIDISVEPSPIGESSSSEPSTSEPSTSKRSAAASMLEFAAKSIATEAGNPKWLIPAAIGCTSVLLLGAAILQFIKTNATFADEKMLTIIYASEHQDELAELIAHGDNIKTHLATKLDKPLQIIMGSHEDIFDIVCLHNNGVARILHLSKNQRELFTAADLAPCLP